MGLDSTAVKFLLSARARGCVFSRTATLGRQSLFLSPESLREVLANGGVDVSAERATQLLIEGDGFCEPLLRLLGATDTSSIDFSPYQSATITHDLNQPVPESLRRRFSLVLDGGTLEHVFNFPRAMANCMEMLEVGGHFLGISPANNFMGHGFYQFSPELYFRVFSPGNGFESPRIILYQDHWPVHDWYEVSDPEVVKSRVTLVNRHPTLMLIQARKTEDVPLFSPIPQQSDYAAWWADSARAHRNGLMRPGSENPPPPPASAVRSSLTRLIPAALKSRYHRWRSGENPFNPAHYTRTGH